MNASLFLSCKARRFGVCNLWRFFLLHWVWLEACFVAAPDSLDEHGVVITFAFMRVACRHSFCYSSEAFFILYYFSQGLARGHQHGYGRPLAHTLRYVCSGDLQ